ncbi:outer membrane protein [Methyloferula stellata]|uniref:outer membrane protein n=1 Tax=Methyloferula stellata TaxID=876270 RepID=UPI0003653701|nr:outer membrane protein [Methyloferula stellata]
MMKRIIFSAITLASLASNARAADLPSRIPPALPPPLIFTWTGVYLGGQVGYQWTADSSGAIYSTGGAALAALQPNFNQAGVIGGGHLGYNWQVNQFVLGVEGDVEGSTLQGSGPYASGVYTLTTNIDVQGSVRGRLGIAWDRLLLYATGGVAFAQIENKYSNTATGLDDLKATRTGWTVGGGVEYAFKPNWSARIEYRYTDLGRYTDLLINSSQGTLGDRRHETDGAVRVGVSYKFDMFTPPPPRVAKY